MAKRKKTKYRWHVYLYKGGDVEKECMQLAETRAIAKDLAAQQWGVSNLSMMTAMKVSV